MRDTMQAMVLTGHGGPEVLVWREDWPKRVPGPDEVLVRVAACGLNNTDINTRSGWYSKGVREATSSEAHDDTSEEDPTWGVAPLTFPRIQGADICGYVEALGNGAKSGRSWPKPSPCAICMPPKRPSQPENHVGNIVVLP